MLRTVPGLSGLSDRGLADLVPLVDRTDVGAGEVLTREGAISRQAFIVLAGRATVFIDGQAMATIGAGEFVGEMGMLDNQPCSATVRADTPMRLLVVGPQAFTSLADHSAVLRAMAVQLAQRLRSVEC
jgi:CRP-like cAMP-binding protein